MPLPRELLEYNNFALDVTSESVSTDPGAVESTGALSDLALPGGRRAPMPTMPPRTENGTNVGEFPDLCYDMLEWFEFPAFEILVTFQVRAELKTFERKPSNCLYFF